MCVCFLILSFFFGHVENQVHIHKTGAMTKNIRVGASFRQNLRLDLMGMFSKFGTPQVFGTWTVDLEEGPVLRSLEKDRTGDIVDVLLFCLRYQHEFHRVWDYIRISWSRRVLGRLRAWAWVTEFQERGAPRVHFVLWTVKYIEELIE